MTTIAPFHPEPLWPKEIYPTEKCGSSTPQPIIIAGPCSAESREQVYSTAKALAQAGVQIFRAGIWKPRTHPGSFEGWGEKALPWLQEVKAETGMLVGCEVGLPKQVEAAEKAGLDYVWIGARTCSNPFSMAELATALQGTHLPVLLKNPLTTSLEIWKGALYRLINAGLTKLALIHRGFDSYATPEYRFSPLWQNILTLRQELPEIPIYFDPSHIAGNATLIEPLLRTALALHYEGMMIESHIHPEAALTDARQQVTPEKLAQLLQVLPRPKQELQMELLRSELDRIDEQFIILLAERQELSKAIGEIKKAEELQARQAKRHADKLERLIAVGEKYHLPAELVQRLYDTMHETSVQIQEKIIHRPTKLDQ